MLRGEEDVGGGGGYIKEVGYNNKWWDGWVSGCIE